MNRRIEEYCEREKDINRVEKRVRSDERLRQVRKAFQDEKIKNIDTVMMPYILTAFIPRGTGKAGRAATHSANHIQSNASCFIRERNDFLSLEI